MQLRRLSPSEPDDDLRRVLMLRVHEHSAGPDSRPLPVQRKSQFASGDREERRLVKYQTLLCYVPLTVRTWKAFTGERPQMHRAFGPR
jgi:hypothetical protein